METMSQQERALTGCTELMPMKATTRDPGLSSVQVALDRATDLAEILRSQAYQFNGRLSMVSRPDDDKMDEAAAKNSSSCPLVKHLEEINAALSFVIRVNTHTLSRLEI